jgi:hypothetical protein
MAEAERGQRSFALLEESPNLTDRRQRYGKISFQYTIQAYLSHQRAKRLLLPFLRKRITSINFDNRRTLGQISSHDNLRTIEIRL